MYLHDKIAVQLPSWRDRVSRLTKVHGTFKVCDVTVEQIYGGIRDVQIQVSDISYVDPQEGIRLRGYTIPECLEKLPRTPETEYPLVGGLYYLLLVDEMPSLEQALLVEEKWKARSQIPTYVFETIDRMPGNTHPMTLFSMAILALQNDSLFARQYREGMRKVDFWKTYLEDSLDLTAKLPGIAAYIYNKKYGSGKYIPPDPRLDWASNFAHMIGKGDDPEYQELTRLFFLIHADHEGGNVSAHTAHLVSSALSDIYLSISAAMNGLAGPLHGLANQECIRWLLEVMNSFDTFPTREQIEQFTWDTLNAGKVIPGYGHAVLRTTDPRFTAQLDFASKYCPDDDLIRLVGLIYEVVPEVLKNYAKVKNPWPNVDAINGALQYHYGVRQFDFYTVLFGISRALGLTAHAVWSRALGKPIERPKSLTTRMLEEIVGEVTSS